MEKEKLSFEKLESSLEGTLDTSLSPASSPMKTPTLQELGRPSSFTKRKSINVLESQNQITLDEPSNQAGVYEEEESISVEKLKSALSTKE
jgi:hypothetical protein